MHADGIQIASHYIPFYLSGSTRPSFEAPVLFSSSLVTALALVRLLFREEPQVPLKM